MVTDRTPATNRPYPPPSNVTDVLARLRNRNLPEAVDAEYLRDANVPDGTNARTLFAFRFLGLITPANEPTSALRSIANSTDEEYRSTLSDLIREAYAEVFVVIDPAQDDQLRVENVFRRYTPASQRSRMVVFFLAMCREAGIATLDVPRQRVSQAAPGAMQQRKIMPKDRPSTKGSARVVVPPALGGLIQNLPPIGTSFPKARQDQWIGMVQATLAYLYPEEAVEEDSEAVAP